MITKMIISSSHPIPSLMGRDEFGLTVIEFLIGSDLFFQIRYGFEYCYSYPVLPRLYFKNIFYYFILYFNINNNNN